MSDREKLITQGETMKTETTLEKVTEAVLPMKEVAQDQAEQMLAARIAETLETLEHDFKWDRAAMAPYPSSLRNSRVDFQAKLSKYVLLSEITEALKPCRGMNDPDYCKRDQAKIDRAIRKVRELAAFTFESYACKLAKKVGTDVVSAKAVSESNLWQSSKLTVYHTDGAFTTWNTQTIVNCSVYGKLFLQFPTRKAKK